jgi:hypothetical protein
MAPDTTLPERTTEVAALVELNRLWARGCDFLGTRTALMGGAMSWVSERHLVSAISNAGGFGVIACGRHASADRKTVWCELDYNAPASR